MTTRNILSGIRNSIPPSSTKLPPQCYVDIFYVQFPSDAEESERMMVPSSYWKDSGGLGSIAQGIGSNLGVEGMVVVVDVEFRRACV
jgi:hypothetical protein